MKHRFWDIYICIVDTSQNIRLLNARYDCLLPEAPSRALWLHKIGELESPWRTLQRFNTLAAWCFAVFLWGYTWLISGINECIYIYTHYIIAIDEDIRVIWYCCWSWWWLLLLVLLLSLLLYYRFVVLWLLLLLPLWCIVTMSIIRTITMYVHVEILAATWYLGVSENIWNITIFTVTGKSTK